MDYLKVFAGIALGFGVNLALLLATRKRWVKQTADRLSVPASMDPLSIRDVTQPIGFPGFKMSRLSAYAGNVTGKFSLLGVFATFYAVLALGDRLAASLAAVIQAAASLIILQAIAASMIKRYIENHKESPY